MDRNDVNFNYLSKNREYHTKPYFKKKLKNIFKRLKPPHFKQ